MPVIPWVFKGQNITITAEYEDFEISGKVVWIENFDRHQFTEEGATNVSYDLRVGQHYRMYRKTRTQVLESHDDSFELATGKAAIIETEETIFLPKSVFGLIIPRETLLQDGISIPPTKIDPGYPYRKGLSKRTGHLHITVFNHSARPYIFKRRERFCALCLFNVDDGIIPYGKGEKELCGGPELPSRCRRLGRWLKLNWWKVLTPIIATGGLVMAILAYVRSLN